jgi:PAS domain S-box-containing protein
MDIAHKRGTGVVGSFRIPRRGDTSTREKLPLILASLEQGKDDNFLHAILKGIRDGITIQDTEGKLHYANDTAAEILGFPSAQSILETPVREIMSRFEMLAEDGGAFDIQKLPGRRALLGEEDPEAMICFRVKETNDLRWSKVRAIPIRDESGKITAAVNVFHDITEQHRQREIDRFLSEASNVLSSSLDYERTLYAIAELAVPTLSDWCTVDIAKEDGTFENVAVVHKDPQKIAWANKYSKQYPPDFNAPRGIPNVLRSGKSELYSHVTPEMVKASARNEEHLKVIEELNMHSAMIVPMNVRERTLGTISFISAESGIHFGAFELGIAEDLARRAAMAVDNAQQYRKAQMEIAERRKAEEALRDSEERMRMFADSSVIGMAFGQLPDTFEYANDEFLRIAGYAREDFKKGKLRWIDLALPEFMSLDQERFDEAKQKGVCTPYEKQMIRKDGSRIDVLIGYALIGEKREEYACFVLDITERKRADAEILKLNQELEQRVADRTRELEQEIVSKERAQSEQRAHLQRLKDIIDHLPIGAVAIDENGKILHTNKLMFDLFPGSNPNDLVGDHAETIFEMVRRYTVVPEQYQEKVDRILRERKPILGVELKLKNGNILSKDYVPLFVDDHYRGMMLLYRDITREKKIDTTKSEFMSLASHQLRTPLTAIRWSLGKIGAAMERGQIGPLERRLLQEGRSAAVRMAETIDTMLMIARIEAGKVQPKIGKIGFKNLLNDLDEQFRHEYEVKSQRFIVLCDAELEHETDESLLKEALQNLIHNAIKYTPEKGTVTVEAKRRKNGVALIIEDNGYGIPVHQQEKLFSKFFRGDNIISRDTNGTGLGLYLVGLLTNLLKGSIDFVSEEGKGTTFTLSLPEPDSFPKV